MRLSFKTVTSVLIASALLLQQFAFTEIANAYSISTKAMFNNPYGTTAQKRVIIDQIKSAILNTPENSVIRIAVYSITLPDITKALVDARIKHKAIVQVVTDDHLYEIEDKEDRAEMTAQLKTLKEKLGTTVTKDGSFIKICSNGCMSNSDYSSVHTKLFMFSTTGSSKRVTMIGSSNLSNTHTNSWNNMYVAVGDIDVYEKMKSYFEAMAKEPNGGEWYSNTLSSTGRRVYTFPHATVDDNGEDIYWSLLNKVKCTGVASGYGYKGKTVIKVAMFKWTDSRIEAAKKLRSLADQGCIVKMAISASEYGDKVYGTLLGGNKIQVVTMEKNKVDGKYVNYVHSKYLMIHGNYDGDTSASIVFTGSPNLTSTSIESNNEVMLRLETKAAHDAYAANFSKMWSVGKRIYDTN